MNYQLDSHVSIHTRLFFSKPMCGIAGILTKANSQAPTHQQLSSMADQLQHRGPDNTGFYQQDQAGLVHTRLSIIDLSPAGNQPFIDKDHDISLVINGEIYNYIELRDQLKTQGYIFTTDTDSEVVLHAYHRYGMDCLDHLLGMFALAIYDGRRQQLFLARDRLGIKPLYYSKTQGLFSFASEIKALLPVMTQAPVISDQALAEFFHNQFSTNQLTPVEQVQSLDAGHYLEINHDLSTRLVCYWFPEIKTDTSQTNAEQTLQQFDDLMQDVMQIHMRSDVPYGLFLSGGVDSSVLLAMLNEHQSEPVKTYSVGFKARSIDSESEAAEAIAKQFKTQHTRLELGRDELFARIPYMIWATDTLMRDYACLPTSMLAERARDDVKVVFSGEGGDEAFAGYRRYQRSCMDQWWRKYRYPGSGGYRTSSQLNLSLMDQWCRPALAESRAYVNAFEPAMRRAAYPFSSGAVKPAITRHNQPSFIQRAQLVDINTALVDNLLVKTDRMTMAESLEGRVPLLDHRIIEFGLNLPDAAKIKNRQGKVFLRRWAEKYLPQAHLQRRKTGFYVPIQEWLQGDFLQQLGGLLTQHRHLHHWFKPEGIAQLVQQQQQGKNVSRELWCLMQFAIWLRLFITHPGEKPTKHENPLDWIAG